MTTTSSRTQRHGWVTFAAVMFLIAGVANLLWGIGALDNKEYLPENGLLFSTLSFWGWVSIVWALFGLIASWLLFTRHGLGVGIGIIVAMISAVFWLFALPVLPIWSLVVIAVDVLIIYGLAVHGAAE